MRLFTRRGCRLCDEAEDLLAVLGYAPAITDVDASPRDAARYGLRVPVLEIDGVVVAEGRFDEQTIAEALAAGRSQPEAKPSPPQVGCQGRR
jgi:glutaredoxin